MKKLFTIVLCLLVISTVAITFFACSKKVTTDSDLLTDYMSIKIGEFTAGEIGAYHNIALSLLKDETMATSTPLQIMQRLSYELPAIDNRFASAPITIACNSFLDNHLVIVKNETTFKRASASDILARVLSSLMSKKLISKDANDEILKLSGMSLIDMKSHTNMLVNSKKWNDQEKQFFAVYTATFENSIIYWTTAKKQKVESVSVYFVDAAGAIAGLGASIYGPIIGAISSIVQGAIASWAYDSPDPGPCYDFDLGCWY